MEFRSIDGSANNAGDPGLNAAGDAFTRIAPARYADGVWEIVGGPNARTVSNIVVGEGEAAAPNGQGLAGMMYAWGQFIDHDLTRTPSDRITDISVAVPADDPDFPDGTTILITRAVKDAGSGTDPGNPAIPVNAVTAWLDASMVYGSDAATAAALRGAGGRMLTSDGDNLPIVNGMFAAGDIRAAENPALTALQTLFVREHNWQVERLQAEDPTLTGDELYDRARAIVAAEIAHITYDEFLPALVGTGAIPAYAGYDPAVDPRLSVEFAGAAYRWGHSTVSAETERKDEFGALLGEGLELRDAFFMPPAAFAADGGADGFLRHLGTDLAQAMDARIVDDLRNFLIDFGVGQDLAALNIQRGRDLGLATLNGTRIALGLTPYAEFEQITDDAATVDALRTAYAGNVEAIDLWTGGLSEKLSPATFLGETFGLIVARQFTALRDGDRLWYQNQGFDAPTLAAIEATSLSDIIRRNTDTLFLQDEVFIFHERRDAASAAEHPELPQLVVGTDATEVLVGGSADDLLFGNGGNDALRGGAGNDAMAGGLGDDAYFVDDAGDETIEHGGEGGDTVYATVHVRLPANVEHLVLEGSADLQGYGNALSNLIYGNDGSNLLDGGSDADGMLGGQGNDAYVIDHPGDVVLENAGEGIDTVYATAHVRLSANVEVLVLQGSTDLQGYGNGLITVIYGNSGSNVLDGGPGADGMLGGEGNDAYFMDHAGDGVMEAAGEGIDTVYATAHAGLSANVEHLVLQGSDDLQGYGNGLSNAIFGNAGSNLLDGGGGADWMTGGAGDDVFLVDDAGDLVTENAGEGSDAVFSLAHLRLAANVEHLVLQGSADLQGGGNSLANVIHGNAGGNLLDGGGGADVLIGNGGNDVFMFYPGEADGDLVVDFTGVAAGGGDVLLFLGFGAGASVSPIDAVRWQVDYNSGVSHDIIAFGGGAVIDPGDILFA